MTSGASPSRRVLVDKADRHLLRDHNFRVYKYAEGLFYATASVNGQTVYLHRLIMGEPRGKKVDHINGNGLDNRRSNLRVTTHKLNLANQRAQLGRSSKYKGVAWNKRSQRWEAYIKVDGRKYNLGLFATEKAAANAYDLAALEAWGEFARPNFLSSTTRKAA